MSKETKKYKALKIIFAILGFICLCVPLAVALASGYAAASPLAALGLSGTMLAALIMVIMSFVFKFDLHSWVWLLVIGLGAAINNFYPFLFAIGICSVAEEIIIRPLQKSFEAKYIANKEIDKRLGE